MLARCAGAVVPSERTPPDPQSDSTLPISQCFVPRGTLTWGLSESLSQCVCRLPSLAKPTMIRACLGAAERCLAAARHNANPTYLGRGIRRHQAQPGGARRRCAIGVSGPRHDAVAWCAECRAVELSGGGCASLTPPPSSSISAARTFDPNERAQLRRSRTARLAIGHAASSLSRCGPLLLVGACAPRDGRGPNGPRPSKGAAARR